MKKTAENLIAIWIALALTIAPVFAGVTHTQSVISAAASSCQNDTGGSTMTITITAPASGSLIVGMCNWAGSTGTITAKDSTNTSYHVGTVIHDSGNSASGQIFWLGNVSNSPTSVTCTFSTSPTFREMMVDVYSGISQVSDPSDGTIGHQQASPGTGANAINTNTYTTTANGDLLWAGVFQTTGGTTDTFSAGTSPFAYTVRNQDTTTECNLTSEDFITQSAASSSTEGTFTQSNGLATVAIGIAFKQPSTVGASQPLTLMGVGN